jgi:UDP-glucose 4-epimerase
VKVLVPGIAGAVGRLLADKLLANGHQVIGIDQRPWKDCPAGVELHAVDVRKRAAEDVFRKHRPDAVVHMATVSHFARARDEERYRINLGGTQAVFEHCQRYGVEHVVFVGRHTYYGAGPDAPLYHREEEPPMALATYPELADLVSADLFAATALWRAKDMGTTVLRFCYTLGPSGEGTLGTFLRGARVPMVLGFDPLFQFLHEDDVASALALAVDRRPKGVFNVAGPGPQPLSMIARAAGRKTLPLPEFVLAGLLGRRGMPKLARGAIEHIKFPVVIDDKAFREATGYSHRYSSEQAIQAFRAAFPPPTA